MELVEVMSVQPGSERRMVLQLSGSAASAGESAEERGGEEGGDECASGRLHGLADAGAGDCRFARGRRHKAASGATSRRGATGSDRRLHRARGGSAV